MRRLIIAAPIVLVLAAAGGAGWHRLRPRDPLAEAMQLVAKGDLRAAQLVLRAAAQTDPARAGVQMQLGDVDLKLGDPVAAERALRAAADHGGDAAALRPLLARAVAAQSRDEEVLRDYTTDGLTPAQAAGVLLARAQAQLGLHHPAEAAASVAEARRLAPDSVEAALAAARLALAGDDRAMALRDVDDALAINPHALEALLLRAELRAVSGDQQGALAAYGAALEQAQATGMPGAVEAVRIGRAGLLLAMGQDAQARADVDAVLKTQPKQQLANFLSATLYARAQDWKAADAALLEVGPLLSRLPAGDITLAVVKSNLGQPEQAIAAAQRQVARAPDDLAGVKLLARLELRANRPDLAVTVLAAARHPDAEVLDLLGGAYAAGGDAGKALGALRQASVLMPADAGLLTRLAALELRQGQAAEATRTLDRALDLVSAAPPPALPVSLQTAAPASTPPAPAAPAAPAAPGPAETAAALVSAALRAGEIDRATAALDRMREAHGDPVQLAMLGGMVKLAQVDLSGARDSFEAARRLDPKATEPRIALARVLMLQGQVPEAAGLLQGVLTSQPANVAALTVMVSLRLGAGQPDQAVAAAEAAHRAAPEDVGIAAGLSGLYLRLQQPGKTLELVDAMEHQAPGRPLDAALLLPRAQAQLALGQRAEAERTLRAVLDRGPDNAALRRQLAELLAGDKDYAAAAALLRDGLARTPGDATLVAASVALAAAEGGPAAALARAETFAQDPLHPAVALPGDVLLSQGKFAAATAAYQAAQAGLAKDDARATPLRLRAAQATAAGGDPAKARAMLADWLATHPDNTETMLALSALDIEARNLPQARDDLAAVLAIQPDNPIALNNLAWVSQQLGDLGRARALAARGYLLGPSPQSADTLGWVMLAQGQVAGAVALLREAANGRPQDPSIRYHLAAALARDGQKDAAVTLLKAVASQPAFDEQPQAARLLGELQAP